MGLGTSQLVDKEHVGAHLESARTSVEHGGEGVGCGRGCLARRRVHQGLLHSRVICPRSPHPLGGPQRAAAVLSSSMQQSAEQPWPDSRPGPSSSRHGQLSQIEIPLKPEEKGFIIITPTKGITPHICPLSTNLFPDFPVNP